MSSCINNIQPDSRLPTKIPIDSLPDFPWGNDSLNAPMKNQGAADLN
jgi:hypothetical protein